MKRNVKEHSIEQYGGINGCSYMFPIGTLFMIKRRVDDFDKKKSVYQTIAYLKGYTVEVSFDSTTGKVSDKFVTGAASTIELDLDAINLSNVPGFDFS